jgi:hypothetical protein
VDADDHDGRAVDPYGLGWFTERIGGERAVWHYGLWGQAGAPALGARFIHNWRISAGIVVRF